MSKSVFVKRFDLYLKESLHKARNLKHSDERSCQTPFYLGWYIHRLYCGTKLQTQVKVYASFVVFWWLLLAKNWRMCGKMEVNYYCVFLSLWITNSRVRIVSFHCSVPEVFNIGWHIQCHFIQYLLTLVNI